MYLFYFIISSMFLSMGLSKRAAEQRLLQFRASLSLPLTSIDLICSQFELIKIKLKRKLQFFIIFRSL
jgi:hypothetical protein